MTRCLGRNEMLNKKDFEFNNVAMLDREPCDF